jgi:hypothetical protein
VAFLVNFEVVKWMLRRKEDENIEVDILSRPVHFQSTWVSEPRKFYVTHHSLGKREVQKIQDPGQ